MTDHDAPDPQIVALLADAMSNGNAEVYVSGGVERIEFPIADFAAWFQQRLRRLHELESVLAALAERHHPAYEGNPLCRCGLADPCPNRRIIERITV